MMTKRRPVAVLMSVHSGENPIAFRRAIESILQQRVSTNVEVRIYLGVDGPVGEQLALAISKLQPHFHKCVAFPQNRGLVFVLNDLIAGLENEDLVFRMDTDDVSHPERLRCQITAMDKCPTIDVLGTAITEITATGLRRVVHFAPSPEAARALISRRVPVAHPTVCIRRRVFDRLGGYPPVRLNEDVALWFDCLAAGFKFANLPDALYDFTVSPSFWKRRGFRKSISEFEVWIKGLWRVEGVTWHYVYPLARLALRLMPTLVQKIAYSSSLRKR